MFISKIQSAWAAILRKLKALLTAPETRSYSRSEWRESIDRFHNETFMRFY